MNHRVVPTVAMDQKLNKVDTGRWYLGCMKLWCSLKSLRVKNILFTQCFYHKKNYQSVH